MAIQYTCKYFNGFQNFYIWIENDSFDKLSTENVLLN